MSLGSSLIKGSVFIVLGVSLIYACKDHSELAATYNDNKSTIAVLKETLKEEQKESPKTEVIESAQKQALSATNNFLSKNDELIKMGADKTDAHEKLLKEIDNLLSPDNTISLPLFGYTDYGWHYEVHVGGQDSDDRVNVEIDFKNDKDELMASTLLRYSLTSKKLGSFSTYYTDAGKNIVQKSQVVVGEANE